MKKLLIAAAIVCAAVVSQGASYGWNISTTGALAAPAGVTFATGKLTTPTMYLFMTTATSAALSTERKNLLAALKTNSTPTGYATTVDLEAGKLNTKYDTTDTTGTYGFYGVIIAEDTAGNTYAYFTSTASASAVLRENGGANISLTGNSTSLKGFTVTAASSAAWYTIAEAAPEPTSGLLLLIGVGALALKRKRA